jgi:hypothetical protein
MRRINKKINWDKKKNVILKTERNISFEQIKEKIMNGEIIDDIQHPNINKYENQRLFVVKINRYIYLVPYVETEKEIFLKTIYPSRKFTKIYIGE